jgi:hypothetical protein
MGTHGKRRSQTIVFCALALLVLVAAFALAACGGSSTTAAAPPAAVGSPSTGSALVSSPSPGYSATALSIGGRTYLVGTDIPAGLSKGTTTGDWGRWQISSDPSPSSIIANDPTAG